jgi:hypothetical protein
MGSSFSDGLLAASPTQVACVKATMQSRTSSTRTPPEGRPVLEEVDPAEVFRTRYLALGNTRSPVIFRRPPQGKSMYRMGWAESRAESVPSLPEAVGVMWAGMLRR